MSSAKYRPFCSDLDVFFFTGETSAVAPRCDYCDKEFTRQCDLYRHLQKTHEDDITEAERYAIMTLYSETCL